SRLLKQLGLQAIQPRSFRPRTTQSRHPLGYSPNLLLEAPLPSGINQVWLGDITFVPLAGARFASLALLMDLNSRRIVGWELEEHMTEALVLGGAATGDPLAAAEPGLDPPHRPRRPVRGGRIPSGAGAGPDGAEHEPAGQLL